MASCGDSRCHIECEEGQGCGCVYLIDEDRCTCECYEKPGSYTGPRVGLTEKVDVSVNGLPLSQVAGQFDRLLAHDVLLPVARAKQPVHLSLKGVTVAAALKSLGLSTRKPTTTAAPKATELRDS